MYQMSLRLRHVISLGVFALLLSSYLLVPTPSDAQTKRPSLAHTPVQVPTIGLNLSPFENRIVGGSNAIAHEFPWQAYLEITTSDGTFSCGGSIIMRQYVLTAAHCVTDDVGDSVAASQIRVYLGLHDRRFLTARSQSRTVISNIVHPSYDVDTSDYDIAVLKLNSPLTLNTYVNTIRLAKSSEPNLFLAGNDVTVSGWGATSYGGSSPNILRKTTVDIVSRSTCNRINSYNGEITGRMLCAARTGKDSCQGDSGGPLFLRDGRLYKQVGVVSFGIGCANPKYPGVYSHLGVLRNWVATKVPSLP